MIMCSSMGVLVTLSISFMICLGAEAKHVKSRSFDNRQETAPSTFGYPSSIETQETRNSNDDYYQSKYETSTLNEDDYPKEAIPKGRISTYEVKPEHEYQERSIPKKKHGNIFDDYPQKSYKEIKGDEHPLLTKKSYKEDSFSRSYPKMSSNFEFPSKKQNNYLGAAKEYVPYQGHTKDSYGKSVDKYSSYDGGQNKKSDSAEIRDLLESMKRSPRMSFDNDYKSSMEDLFDFDDYKPESTMTFETPFVPDDEVFPKKEEAILKKNDDFEFSESRLSYNYGPESKDEVHYHQHKHIHQHAHKAEHAHKHAQEHSHHHGHKHEGHHSHGHKHEHAGHHEHHHGHEHAHKNDHKHEHKHDHKEAHKHGHKHKHDSHHKHDEHHKSHHKHNHHHKNSHDHHESHKHNHHGHHKHNHHHKHHGHHSHNHHHHSSHHGKH